jgi:hypothetical protein
MIDKTGVPAEWAYALRWVVENQRCAGWNGHRRTIDAILPEPYVSSVRALEVVEKVTWWLGSPEGQAMIKAAEAEIEETGKALREEMQMKARAAQRAMDLARTTT